MSSERREVGPRVPGVSGDPRDSSSSREPWGKTWFRDLDEAVIEADRCIQCGSCVRACPSDSIGIDDALARPTLVRMCTGCSRCWDFCPRSGLRYERVLADETAQLDGVETIAARARQTDFTAVGQDGGVVSVILARLLEANEIDGALVARERPDEPLSAESYMATSATQIRESAGSRYAQPMQLGRLEEQIDGLDVDDPRIAIVGTPCVFQGLAALQRFPWEDGPDPIALTISLMCTRSFDPHRLRSRCEGLGVDPSEIARIDVSDGILLAENGRGQPLLEVPVETFDSAALRGCDECADFVGEAADISAGSVGSPDGFTTVMLRSEQGRGAWELVADAFDTTAVEEREITRIEDWNGENARRALQRTYDPSGSIEVSYADHRRAYDDSDRAPEPLNPARVHQYEEWC